MKWLVGVCFLWWILGSVVSAQDLPTGYLVWSKGAVGSRTSRKIYRMTLPDKSDVRALTAGEDVECQISPDGQWVAYAKAASPSADYHAFGNWSLYVVSIEGINHGGIENLIDDYGYWPSWAENGELYYSRRNGQHTDIMKVALDGQGKSQGSTLVASTQVLYGASVPEINECFVAPDGSWFAGRTRSMNPNGVYGYLTDGSNYEVLGWSGSVGCMSYVAPSGEWGFLAGASNGIRWGHAPNVGNRTENGQLVAAQTGKSCYHPGISTDGNWFMTGQSTDSDQNAGAWDIYIYTLNGQSTSNEQPLLQGGFNGWPHMWVGNVSDTDGGLPDGDGGGSGDDGGVSGDDEASCGGESTEEEIIIKAKDMTLSGGYQVGSGSDSGYIETMTTGEARTDFAGSSGLWTGFVDVVAEFDGIPHMVVKIAGMTIADFDYPTTTLDRDVQRIELGERQINNGDEVLLIGTLADGAAARVDRLLFQRTIDGGECPSVEPSAEEDGGQSAVDQAEDADGVDSGSLPDSDRSETLGSCSCKQTPPPSQLWWFGLLFLLKVGRKT